MTFALIGNQNSGKTTLFNLLTGSSQHVGNFPGVTVEYKTGIINDMQNVSIVDLPGIYSITPYSQEEIITRDFLLTKKVDGIINIIDVTNIERSLYLTLQLLELKLPTIVTLNMMDEFLNNNGKINIPELSKELGVPIIPISAKKNTGINTLKNSIINLAPNKFIPLKHYTNPHLHQCINEICNILIRHAPNLNISPIFYSIKFIEGDFSAKKLLNLTKTEINSINHSIYKLEQKINCNKLILIAESKYKLIENICNKTVVIHAETKEHKKSTQLDKLLTNKYLALPIFFSTMFIIFWLTFDGLGNTLSSILSYGINYITLCMDNMLNTCNVAPIVHSLIIDGIFTGIGSIMSFLPIIVVLFFFLSILEDSGYMVRIAFIIDKILNKIGLSGKSFVPMLIGFGCSVPAVMATRTLNSERDKKLTLFMIPYISCSAKLPIYALFCHTFFKNSATFVMFGLYITGIIIGITIIYLLRNSFFINSSSIFLMEIPNYRIPSIKNTFILLWNKIKDFLEKAFTLIFISSIIIWFLQTFDTNLSIVQNNETSLLASISKYFVPIFTPIGLGDWKIITALVSGITAKEAIISTLNILTNNNLASLFSTLTALCFLIFILLYTPCIATLAAINRELNSGLKTIFILLFQCLIAWTITFLFFHLGKYVI